MAMKFGSLFSGIGGFDLGLERAGWSCAWQVEIDPYKRVVLAEHWPTVTRYEDVRDVRWAEVEPVELLAGGFPCQDTSDAGRRAGIEGEQSGLWAHFHDAIRILRPRFVLLENSTGLLARGMGRVVGDLAASGYDAEWDCIPAAALGSPQLRVRLWVVAYPRGDRDETHDAVQAGWAQLDGRPRWDPEPRVGRVVDGVPSRLDRLRVCALGDAVVPGIVEMIGRGLLDELREEV